MVDDAYVPIEKVAEHFAVSVSTVRTWLRNEDIPALKLGGIYRFKLSEVEAKLRNTEVSIPQEVAVATEVKEPVQLEFDFSNPDKDI
jgi:excisionase family DNA binding protein|tara:strand:+ start:601 stop:861 length:261 start_codon:yes stop_codon:yes gene_type:complete